MHPKTRWLTLFYFLVAFGFSVSYLYLPDYFQSLDARLHDFYLNYRGAQKAEREIVIVDIDEKSIASLGQWPWERKRIATIIQHLTDAKAGIIGLDMIFSEPDKTSPKQIAKHLTLKGVDLEDYDAILAEAIEHSPTVVGYLFDFAQTHHAEAPQIPAIFVQRHAKVGFIPEAQGVLPNIPIIQSHAYSSGYLNNLPDTNGMIRSIPLLIAYQGQLYPSLALEMYRLALGYTKVSVDYSEIGVERLTLGDRTIPTDRFGKLHLNFRGGAHSYRYLSAVDIYHNHFDPEAVAGKFILIGTSAYGLMDLRSTPMDSVIAGVEIHANALDNLLHHDMIYQPAWVEAFDLLSIWVVGFWLFFLLSRLSFLPLLVGFGVTLAGVVVLHYMLFVHAHILVNSIFLLGTLFVSLLVVLGINYLLESRQKELIRATFAKKVSASVADTLIAQGDQEVLAATMRNITIFFSDIRGFTGIAERLDDPQKLIDFLNLYMTPMTEIILSHEGTVDKFIGDAIMAYWNAPLDTQNHADKAVQSALAQHQALQKLNAHLATQHLPTIAIGIGINTGDAVVGEMGSQGRSDYTIIGDSVNLASRLEGLCKLYGAKIILSHATKEALTGVYHLRFLDTVRVKGKQEPVRIYEVLQHADRYATAYQEAQDYYQQGAFEKARGAFQALEAKAPQPLYRLYRERCERLLAEDSGTFDGVFTLDFK